MDGIRIRLLGRFGVDLPDGRQAGPWERPIARRLVQLLAISPSRRAGREQISEALFANLAPVRAANAVSKAITMARSALAPYDLIEADRDGVWLSDRLTVEVDIDVLRNQLESALAMPSGEQRASTLRAALSDRRELLGDELYSDWTAEARDQLTSLRVRATAALAAEAGTAEAWADLVACDPTNEDACLQLMHAYVADGRRDRAVRTFHRTTAALADELDVDPSAAFVAEVAELLAEPTLPRRRARQVVPARVVGRDLQIDRVVADMRAGRAVLISGPAGIGKSLLLDHVTYRLAEEGWTVCHGVAVPGDRRAPYAALRAALSGLDATNLPFVTELMDERTGPTTPQRAVSDRARLVDEIAEVLDAGSEAGPILVVLDDLQWMDEALHDVVGRLAVRSDGSRWSLLVAGRDDEPAAPLPDLTSRVGRLVLGPLTESDLRDVLVAHGLAEGVLADVVRRSEGNPFFAIELARHGHHDQPAGSQATPERIATLIGSRLQRCSPAARRLAAVVALAGNDATYELIVRLGDDADLAGSPHAAIAALDELVEAHLAVETEHGLRLAHPLVVETSLSRLNRIRRGALHDRLATALEATGGLQSAARHRLAAFETAGLATLAGPAVRAGYLAGRHARSLFADEVAIELLRGATAAFQAIPAPDRGPFHHEAVAAYAEIGDILLDGDDVAGAGAAYHAGLALATTDTERARVWSAIGGLHYRSGDLVAAVAAYRRGLATLADRSTEGARLESDLGWSLWRLGEQDEAIELLGRATAVLERTDRYEAARAFDRLAVALAGAGQDQAAALAWQRGLDLASAEGDPRLIGVLHFHAGCILVDAGRWAEALVEVELAQHFRQGSTDLYVTALTHSARADCLNGLGRLDEALAARELECDLFDTLGNLRQLAVALAGRSVLLRALGRHEEAEHYAEAALDAARRCTDKDRVTEVAAVLAAPVPRRPG